MRATVLAVGKGKKKQKARKEQLRAELKACGVKKLPKTECCVSKDRCGRCPIRMLKEGTLPAGYTVNKRKLVKVDSLPAKKKSKKLEHVA